MTIHPALTMDFDTLVAGLEAARSATLVYRRDDPATGRSLYCYTARCVYEQAWDEYTVLARGLILDLEAREIIALPFPKFFNVGEGGRSIPDLSFEVYEKVDGSLAIIHYASGEWRAATKGSLTSPQAQWAEARLDAQDTSALVPGVTYLAEVIGPDNRIVVHYAESGLVLLAAYNANGVELDFGAVEDVAIALGWRVARRHFYPSFADLLIDADILPASAEGFVIRFSDGTRLKVKGSEYRRIHALVSRCTPLSMWEAMAVGDDMEAIRRDLPEEFWGDFDQIVGLIGAQRDALVARIGEVAATVAHLSDKELGLGLNTLPEDARGYLFSFRKGGVLKGKPMQSIMRDIRPTGNSLPGYTPSYALNRVIEESA